MGLISRIRRLTVSRIESFLNTVEDPEILFPQLIREMEDQVRAATDAESKAMAAVKTAERGLGETAEKLERMTKGAELAVEKGDEATARDAISAQIGLEADSGAKQKNLEMAKATYEDASDARQQIQKQLDELRNKKDEILTRARVARSQQKIEKTVSGPVSSSGSILDAVAQLESKVDEAEAELEVRRSIDKGGAEPSLDKRLDALGKDSEVEKRLAALKEKTGGSKAE